MDMEGVRSKIKEHNPLESRKVSAALWKQGLAELIGSALFAFFSVAVLAGTGNIDREKVTAGRVVTVVIGEGFLYYGLLSLTMRLSDGGGGYLNPAITFAMYILDVIFDKKFWAHTWKFLFFVTVQLIGMVGGTFLTLIAMPSPLNGNENTGVAKPASFGPSVEATIGDAFAVEAISSFFLCMVILAVRRNERRRSSVLIVFVYMAIRFMMFPSSGGYANPARAFGSAVVGNGLDTVWIYLFSAPIGALVAALSFYYLNHQDFDVDDAFPDSNDSFY